MQELKNKQRNELPLILHGIHRTHRISGHTENVKSVLKNIINLCDLSQNVGKCNVNCEVLLGKNYLYYDICKKKIFCCQSLVPFIPGECLIVELVKSSPAFYIKKVKEFINNSTIILFSGLRIRNELVGIMGLIRDYSIINPRV